jgi:hypothetical protein
MIEDKIKLNIDPPEIKVLKFNQVRITVRPYLTLEHKIELIQEYIDILFGNAITEMNPSEIGQKYIIAEYALVNHIVDILTNIEITDLDNDALFYGELWDQIKANILNYDIFRKDLDKAIEYYLTYEKVDKSVGNVLDSLFRKVLESLSKFSNVDVESYRETAGELTTQLNKLNEFIPGILSDEKEQSDLVKEQKASTAKKRSSRKKKEQQ